MKQQNKSIYKFQYSGTTVISLNKTANQVKTTGSDPIALGRLSWIFFKGKNNNFTRIISAYVPCKGTQNRHQIVYNQHKRHFLS